MKFGISTHSLHQALRSGELDPAAVIAFIAEIGAEHVEICAIGPMTPQDTAAAASLASVASDHGLTISSYTVGGNFLATDNLQDEIDRLKAEVDKGAAMGVTRMRHDCAWRPMEACIDAAFEQDLPVLIEGCRAVALYAAEVGITTSVENHGYHVQRSDRVLRLVAGVGLDNYRITIDIGNFLCVDEDPLAAVQACLPLASMVHVKDFLIRDAAPHLDKGWFATPGNRRLYGSVFGFGDIKLAPILAAIATSGYDDCISLEYEGKEPCQDAVRRGLDNLKSLWQHAASEA